MNPTTKLEAASIANDPRRDAALPLWREAVAGLDWLSLRLSGVYAGRGVPRGDGSAVILVPGMLASDVSLIELHAWIGRIGYRPYFSNIGRNMECPEVMLARLMDTVAQAYAETGRKVRIIGHSLGGLLARGAALRRPDLVAQVVTLGSPVQGVCVHPAVLAAADLLCGDCDRACMPAMQSMLPSAVTEANIYSKHDGVVDWRTCIREDASSIEVRSTHVGLIVSAAAYRAMADVLAAEAAARAETEPVACRKIVRLDPEEPAPAPLAVSRRPAA